MSRVKFKIMYPEDYHVPEKRGKPYLPGEGNMVVMAGNGVFYQVGGIGDYYMGMTKLSKILHKYDVVWK